MVDETLETLIPTKPRKPSTRVPSGRELPSRMLASLAPSLV